MDWMRKIYRTHIPSIDRIFTAWKHVWNKTGAWINCCTWSNLRITSHHFTSERIPAEYELWTYILFIYDMQIKLLSAELVLSYAVSSYWCVMYRRSHPFSFVNSHYFHENRSGWLKTEHNTFGIGTYPARLLVCILHAYEKILNQNSVEEGDGVYRFRNSKDINANNVNDKIFTRRSHGIIEWIVQFRSPS